MQCKLYLLQSKVSYTYKEDSTRNYGLVESYKYSVGTVSDETNNTLSNAVNDSLYTYTYDTRGYITEIKCNGNESFRYYYDDLGQLIRADECEAYQTLVMEYDEGGNITSIKEYDYCLIDEYHFLYHFH